MKHSGSNMMLWELKFFGWGFVVKAELTGAWMALIQSKPRRKTFGGSNRMALIKAYPCVPVIQSKYKPESNQESTERHYN